LAIEPGQTVPNVTLKQMTPEGIKDVATADLLTGKRVIIFGVPGAYTPVCSTKHLPGYVEQADRLKAEGTDEIVCVSVHDPFVMSAWAEKYGATGKVLMLCDPKAELTRALGLDLDLPVYGLYSMVVENGVVKSVNVETSIFDHESSAALRLLAPGPVL
jgi:glutaredoxin/glutathione-dependent peroxiredoxin